jgi:hypothetical protein
MPTNHFRARRARCTLNNPTAEELATIEEKFKNGQVEHLAAAIFAKEHWTGPEGSTPHLQFFIRFTKDIIFSPEWKAEHGLSRAHIASCDMSNQANWDYCKKETSRKEPHNPEWGEEVWFTFGNPDDGDLGKQGQRTEINEITQRIKDGWSLDKIIAAYPHVYCKFHAGIDKMFVALQPRRARIYPRVLVLYGETGTHKSHMAHELCESLEENYFQKDPSMEKWWSGYSNQKVMMIEEFTGNIPLKTLLQLLDCYPLQLQTKGSSCKIQVNTIVICSSIPPWEWYQNMDHSQGKIAQLQRRICRENQDSRIICTTTKKFMNWENQELDYQLMPDWLSDCATEILNMSDTRVLAPETPPQTPLQGPSSELVDLTQE